MIIYIASPYTKGCAKANVRRQIHACEAIRILGHVPLWPLASHYWHELYPHDWDFWMEICLEILPLAHAVVRLAGESAGADIEVAKAIELGIPVYFSIGDLPIKD